jgi:hydrogenase/urease accessory protein HupE
VSPLTLVVIAFFLALLLFGFAWGAPIYAVPLALLFVVGFGIAQLVRRKGASRQLRDFRGQSRRAAPGSDVEFTDRDQETLYHRD